MTALRIPAPSFSARCQGVNGARGTFLKESSEILKYNIADKINYIYICNYYYIILLYYYILYIYNMKWN